MNADIQNDDLREELLDTWLDFNSAVRNERIVKGFTFREIVILHILSENENKKDTQSSHVTATDIVNSTGMLKPQVNKLLTSLERRRLIKRSRSESDRRYVLISLTPSGRRQYLSEHDNILDLIGHLIDKLGNAHTHTLISNLNDTAAIIDTLLK